MYHQRCKPRRRDDPQPVDGRKGVMRGALQGRVMAGMGDDCTIDQDGARLRITQTGLRIVRGLEGAAREAVLDCWIELWRGAIDSGRAFLNVSCEVSAEQLTWTVSE